MPLTYQCFFHYFPLQAALLAEAKALYTALLALQVNNPKTDKIVAVYTQRSLAVELSEALARLQPAVSWKEGAIRITMRLAVVGEKVGKKLPPLRDSLLKLLQDAVKMGAVVKGEKKDDYWSA